MSGIEDALDHARSEAQDLHKKVEASTARDHAALRADVVNAAVQAKKLAASLQTLGDALRADAKQHVQDAVAQLEDAAKHVRDVTAASEAELKRANLAMLENARSAVQSLSEAVASQRSAPAGRGTDNYVAVVFENEQAAFTGLHALWNLDSRGDITVHGAAVARRDEFGHIQFATKDTDAARRTAVGVGLAALLGVLTGPLGAIAGATIAVGATAAIGAAEGGRIALTLETGKSGEHEQVVSETGFVLQRGQSAILAELSETRTAPLDAAATRLGGVVFRRQKGRSPNDSHTFDYYGASLYPYDYEPRFG